LDWELSAARSRPNARRRPTLLLAEEHIAAQRTKVVVTDLTMSKPVPIDTLRELAEEEAGEKKR
jgi:hypothetical protein